MVLNKLNSFQIILLSEHPSLMLLNYIILHTIQQTKPYVARFRHPIMKYLGSHSAPGL